MAIDANKAFGRLEKLLDILPPKKAKEAGAPALSPDALQDRLLFSREALALMQGAEEQRKHEIALRMHELLKRDPLLKFITDLEKSHARQREENRAREKREAQRREYDRVAEEDLEEQRQFEKRARDENNALESETARNIGKLADLIRQVAAQELPPAPAVAPGVVDEPPRATPEAAATPPAPEPPSAPQP